MANAAPTNSGPPSITGTAQQGQILTLHQGTWTDTATPTPTITITNQWEVCTGSACSAISGQTGATHAVTAGDVGHTIEVLETASTTTDGSATASSAPTAIVTALAPVNTIPPVITGTAQKGQILTLTQGQWSNSPTITDQWEDCTGATCSAITGQTGPTYTVSAGDVGHTIEVLETATNTGGKANASSTPTALIAAPPTEISAPSISGTPVQGSLLTENHGTWTGSPTSYSYQWERCVSSGCGVIPGAISPSYTLTIGDLGAALLVAETAINAGGPSAPADSALTGVVTAPAGVVTTPVPTSSTSLVVSPSGPMTNQTVTLVATVSSSSGNPSGWLTFFDGNNAISACANQSLKSTSPSITIICQSSFPAGTARLTALFTPGWGSLLQASASPLITLGVGRDSTSTSLAVTKQVVRRKRATYTATLVLPVSNSGPIKPNGSMQFLDSGRPIPGCLRRPLTQLTATCAVNYKSVGRHDISARYTGDSNFGSSTSPTRSVRIVKDSSAPIIVLGFISSTLQWQFHYHRAYTQVTMLRADGLVKGTTVLLTCEGTGCPTSQRSFQPKTGTSINLLPVFQSRDLRVGSRITVRIMRPHWIGKYYSFTVRAGSGPLILLSCLGVGRTRPGVGC